MAGEAAMTEGAMNDINEDTFARLPLAPYCRHWGISRGTPIDRYYINRFLRRSAGHIRGRVLEVKSASYASLYGDRTKIENVDVIDILAENTNATLHVDLAAADRIPDATYDCFILTQTLNIIYDVHAACAHAVRILKPGGMLLGTVSAVNRISAEDGGLDEDYWRFTSGSIRKITSETPRATQVQIETFGNVLACCAFLYGLPAEAIASERLDHADPYFPVVYGFSVIASELHS
jgi:SAM-dependent methyltransferase